MTLSRPCAASHVGTIGRRGRRIWRSVDQGARCRRPVFWPSQCVVSGSSLCPLSFMCVCVAIWSWPNHGTQNVQVAHIKVDGKIRSDALSVLDPDACTWDETLWRQLITAPPSLDTNGHASTASAGPTVPPGEDAHPMGAVASEDETPIGAVASEDDAPIDAVANEDGDAMACEDDVSS